MSNDIWQDQNASVRGHKLLTEALARSIPSYRSTADSDDAEELVAHAKLFTPFGSWTWYVIELEAETGKCFGLVFGESVEFGDFYLQELAEMMAADGVAAVERDLYWESATVREVRTRHPEHGGS